MNCVTSISVVFEKAGITSDNCSGHVYKQPEPNKAKSPPPIDAYPLVRDMTAEWSLGTILELLQYLVAE